MAEQMLDMAPFRELLAKKWLEPTAKREDLAHLQALSLPERRACSIVNAHRKMIREHGLTRFEPDQFSGLSVAKRISSP